MNIYEQFCLTKVINASGPATVLGGAKTSKAVSDAVANALSISVEMVELQARASKVIANFSGAEAGFITNCAAAGISIAVAASMTGDNVARIKKIPNVENLKSSIVIQKGQLVPAGETPIELLVRITGASLIEIGEASQCAIFQLQDAIKDSHVAAALYINTERARGAGIIPPISYIKTCRDKGIPVIVDDADGCHIKEFIDAGADLVIASSHKYLCGPTAGIIAGKKDFIYACFLQEHGIGRPMKAGKESIIGTIVALNEIKTRDLGPYKEQQINKANYMAKRLDGIAGVKVDIAYNVNSTAMVLLTIDPELTKITAWEINRLLEEQSPIIKTRDYDASQGYFSLEPAFLDEEDVKLVCDRLVSIFQNASKQDLSAIVEVPTRLDHMVSIKKKWLYM